MLVDCRKHLTFDGENKLSVEDGVTTAVALVLMHLNRGEALANLDANGKRLFCNWIHLEDVATSRSIFPKTMDEKAVCWT